MGRWLIHMGRWLIHMGRCLFRSELETGRSVFCGKRGVGHRRRDLQGLFEHLTHARRLGAQPCHHQRGRTARVRV
eukprot:7873159-Pyramimonas_sp.AAC.1